jgi:hypothetical protein
MVMSAIPQEWNGENRIERMGRSRGGRSGNGQMRGDSKGENSKRENSKLGAIDLEIGK